MRNRQKALLVGAASTLLTAVGMGTAWAATNGNVNLTVTGASFSGTYRYDVKVNSTQSGVQYVGTLNNSGQTDTHTAYVYAKVEGYGWSELGRAAYKSSTNVDRVVYDPAALYVRHSQAQVCRDRTVLGQNCSVGTYNY